VLERLAEFDAESARIVELRFYAGLTIDEIATNLAVSESTVHRRWRSARAWLFKEMQIAA
ncbi:MAG: ECF-type sigma factor, partial [Pseudomonadota bacterium]|nr:ECF-type sigma factor [Pseudomonadota bacterium]